MAVFFDAVGGSDLYRVPHLSLPGPMELNFWHTASGSQVGVVVAVSYWANVVTTIDNLTRNAFYDGNPMTSLGVQQWGGSAHGWTELFGILNPDNGRKRVRVSIIGGALGGRISRATSLSYTGVDSFGTVTNASGAGAGRAPLGTRSRNVDPSPSRDSTDTSPP